MALAELINRLEPYTSKIVAFGGLNRVQESSPSTLSSNSNGSTETAEMLDCQNVTLDENGDLTARPQRAVKNYQTIYMESAIECIDYRYGRDNVMACIGRTSNPFSTSSPNFYFGDEVYSPGQIGADISGNQMVVINTKLCFFPSKVYFDLRTHSFGDLDSNIDVGEGKLEPTSDGAKLTFLSSALYSRVKADTVYDFSASVVDMTGKYMGQYVDDEPTSDYLRHMTYFSGSSASTLRTQYDVNWYARVGSLPVINSSNSQMAAFKQLVEEPFRAADKFELTSALGGSTSNPLDGSIDSYSGYIVHCTWYFLGSRVGEELFRADDFLVKYGIDVSQKLYTEMVRFFNVSTHQICNKQPYRLISIQNDSQDGTSVIFESNLYNDLFPGDSRRKILSNITLSQTSPLLQYVVCWNNRLWGVSNEDNNIYASKLGDPTQWNYFQGTSMDSYYAEQGTPGNWTGSAVYNNHVLFFKERHIHRVYGSSPSSFQLSVIEAAGVKDTCFRSVATVNNTLFYYSPNGFMAYVGEFPEKISTDLGKTNYQGVSAGYKDNRYYAHIISETDGKNILVFDTELGAWFLETCRGSAYGFLYNFNGDLYHHDVEISGGRYFPHLSIIEPGDIVPSGYNVEPEFIWYAIFKFDEVEDGNKIYSKFNLRAYLTDDSQVKISIAQNKPSINDIRSEGDWNVVGVLSSEYGSRLDGIEVCDIVPVRCNNIYIRIAGMGNCTIKSLTRKYRAGVERSNR